MSIEGSQWLPDRSEPSKEEDKDLKAKDKNNKTPKSRWVRPPLFGAELPKPNQTNEVSLRLPIPIEKINTDEKTKESDSQNEKSESKIVSGEKVEAAKLLDIPHIAEGEPFKGPPSEPWESISGRSPFSESVPEESRPEAETASKPHPMMRRALTEYALMGFLAERKQQRYDRLEQQLQARDTRIDQLQQQQRRANENVAAQNAHVETAAVGGRPGEQALFDQEGNEIFLRPGWHVERSPGGFSVVLDEHGRVIHDAIKYGEAFKREQQREQLSDDLFNAISSGGVIGVPTIDPDNVTQQAFQQQGTPQHTGYEALPPETVDLRHRLPRPRMRASATLASPWLWTAVAILIIVYFVASLA